MNKIVEALRETGIFYVSTVEDDQPKVRPFGAVMDLHGTAYFCTNNTKDVYRQLIKNPKTQICGCRKDGGWVRVTGKLIRDDSDAARAAMLEALPGLKRMYSVGDGIFEVFRLEQASALLYSRGAAPVEIEE